MKTETQTAWIKTSDELPKYRKMIMVRSSSSGVASVGFRTAKSHGDVWNVAFGGFKRINTFDEWTEIPE